MGEITVKQFASRNIVLSFNTTLLFAFAFLAIPFFLFCFGFLKIIVSFPICLLFLILTVRKIINLHNNDRTIQVQIGKLIVSLLIIMGWVYLSGIGGGAFQNTDFHIRNAIFRDLITHSWPVKYTHMMVNSIQPFYLVYYIGYWLPAALVGKLTNWTWANIALYIWTVAGIFLVLVLVSFKIKMSLPKLLLILVFFSGMDALGVLISMVAQPGMYNILWPPVYSIEWWIYGFQYSSFSTQLFWVFNQAVPAWICMAILITQKQKVDLFLTWSFCCFFAPLPAIGMLPYVLLKIPEQLFDSEQVHFNILSRPVASLAKSFFVDIKKCLTIENVLGGGSIVLISFLYFCNNYQARIPASPDQIGVRWVALILFIFFEGGFLWWILRKNNQNNLNWMLVGVLLITIPLIHIGSAQDFCMRGSIPTLFYLFIFAADRVSMPRSSLRSFVIILLVIGSYTGITEIYRSIYRTADYYLHPPTLQQKLEGEQMRIYSPTFTEKDHPYTLVANSFKSLENFTPVEVSNFVAQVEKDSFFAKIVK